MNRAERHDAVPDADDLVIEILTGQMIDFDESSTGVLEIFAVRVETRNEVEQTRGRGRMRIGNSFAEQMEAELQSWQGRAKPRHASVSWDFKTQT